MSELMLNVSDASRSVHCQTYASHLDYVVAALAAEPETLEELESALSRFWRKDAIDFFSSWHLGTNEEPWDAGIAFVDFAAKMVVMQSSYSAPTANGYVTYRDENGLTGVLVRYHVSDDWLFSQQVDGWAGLRDKRLKERASAPPLDTRKVIYSKVCEFIARECFAAATNGGLVGATDLDEEQHDALREAISAMHARWLTTPRDDLRGQAPRNVLLAKRDHLSWDENDRCEQWSIQGKCPPGVDRESAAYRLGGYGTHEVVLYYDLVRDLFWNCHEHLAEKRSSGVRLTESSDMISEESRRLDQVRDVWLESPMPDMHGYTAEYVIDRERARLPMAVSGAEAAIDHDCPMCQMMAEDMSPYFWHLDGCNMDDDFAFSFHRTREEWDEEQREYEEFNRQCEEREKRRKKNEDFDDETPSIWKRSFVAENADESGATTEMVLLGIGAHLAELNEDLKQTDTGDDFAAALNRHFSNLRETVQDPNAALVEPVVERFCEDLDAIGYMCPELQAKCDDLSRQLRGVAKRFGDVREWNEDLPF